LEHWVEDGVPPERIVAVEYVDDDPAKGILRTRPLCRYPMTAVYKGTGSTDEAANFECRMPRDN
jgi:feruloyl esterase